MLVGSETGSSWLGLQLVRSRLALESLRGRPFELLADPPTRELLAFPEPVSSQLIVIRELPAGSSLSAPSWFELVSSRLALIMSSSGAAAARGAPQVGAGRHAASHVLAVREVSARVPLGGQATWRTVLSALAPAARGS